MAFKSFVAVKFEDNEEIKIASGSWLKENGKKCVWPKYQKTARIDKAIQTHESPAANWKSRIVQILWNGKRFGKKKL